MTMPEYIVVVEDDEGNIWGGVDNIFISLDEVKKYLKPLSEDVVESGYHQNIYRIDYVQPVDEEELSRNANSAPSPRLAD